jgi:hypothetical protein
LIRIEFYGSIEPVDGRARASHPGDFSDVVYEATLRLAFLDFEDQYLFGRSAKVAVAHHSEAEQARDVVCKAEEGVSAQRESTGSVRDRGDQYQLLRMGQLLAERQVEPLSLHAQTLGVAKDSAAHDEFPAASGMRWTKHWTFQEAKYHPFIGTLAPA